MKTESFYRKYANVPLEKRFTQVELIQYGYAHSYSLADLYVRISKADEERREAAQELESLLKTAQRLMHSYPLK